VGAEVIVIDRKGTSLSGDIAADIKANGFKALVNAVNSAYDQSAGPKVERFQAKDGLDDDFKVD